MTRKLTTFVAAAALAMTSFAAQPAMALDRDDALKLLLGAIVIGAVVKNADKKRDRKKEQQQRMMIPANCVTEVKVRNRWRDVVGARCVERSDFRGTLPEDCAFTARVDRRNYKVFGLNCLEDKGYRIEAARR